MKTVQSYLVDLVISHIKNCTALFLLDVSYHNLDILLLQAMGTALSMLASVPLGELFFFHMILIRKVNHLVITCHYPFPVLLGLV